MVLLPVHQRSDQKQRRDWSAASMLHLRREIMTPCGCQTQPSFAPGSPSLVQKGVGLHRQSVGQTNLFLRGRGGRGRVKSSWESLGSGLWNQKACTRDVFDLLITSAMGDLLTNSNNSRKMETVACLAEEVRTDKTKTCIRTTTSEEVCALFGLMYIRALLGLRKQSVDKLFPE